jgi:hypothetical protein
MYRDRVGYDKAERLHSGHKPALSTVTCTARRVNDLQSNGGRILANQKRDRVTPKVLGLDALAPGALSLTTHARFST